MSYKINKTDGSLLIDLANATVDSETTNLTLVGKGYAGYGEIFNENFVKLLENFSSVTAPTTPLTGQLWYDSSESRLKVYNGASWKSTDTVTVSNVQPPMVSGDLWIDSNNEQLYFTQGTDVLLAGPIYTRTQQLSGLDVKDITDTSGIKHTIVRQFIGGTLMAVHAKSSIVYDATNSTNLSILPGYTSPINVGINVSPAQTGFAFNGTATTSKNIISSAGDSYTPEDLLRLALDNTTAGKLHIKNDNGLTVGVDSDYVIKVGTVGTGSTIRDAIINRVQTGGSDWRLQIKQGTVIKTAISVENSTTRIGFWNEAPEYSLDLTGNLRVTGDVIVEGTLSASTFSSLDGYSNTSVDTHLNQTNPTSGYVLSWNGTDYAWVAQSGSGGSGIALTDLSVGSVGTASGNGSIAYNNITGVFTYTPPVLYSNTEVDAHINVSGASTSQVLSWNGTDYAWVAQAGAGSVTPSSTDTFTNKSGNISQWTNDSSYLTSVPAQSFASLTSKPTTLSGYGITDGYANSDVDTHLNQTNPTSGYVLSWNGTDYAWTLNGTGTGIGDIVDDATPQLGGDLDVNGNKITSNSNTDVIIEPNGTGNFVVETDTLHLKNTNNGNIGTRLFLDHITTTPEAADNNSQILVRTNEAGEAGAVGALATTFRIIVTSPDNTAGASTGKAVFDIKEDATSSPITYMDLDGDQEEIYFYKDIQVSGNITVTGTVNTAGGLKVSGNIEEKFTTLTSAASTVTHDCSTASLFYHTGATGDFTVNLTNINSTVEYAKGISVVVNQSSTAYMPTALQIGGAAQTINWQGGSAPSGTANGVDNVSFTIINDGGTYVVLGQAVAYS